MSRFKNLYVIRLEETVLKKKKFIRENPEYLEGKPCVYVGSTAHNPEKRFKQHKKGYKASRYAKKYGQYLMKRKYKHLNPVPSSEAEEKEAKLAESLRRKGFAVWQR